MSVLLTIAHDEAARAIAEVSAKLAPGEPRIALMNAVGSRAAAELRAWFYRRDAESPNRFGWPRKHFWLRIQQATVFDPTQTTETAATVTVAEPALAAKIAGATIRPRPPHRALALPLNAEAYAAGSPGDPAVSKIPSLFVLRRPETNGAYLVRREGEGKSARLVFYYRLLPAVTLPKDPQALPPADELGAALVETAASFFFRK